MPRRNSKRTKTGKRARRVNTDKPPWEESSEDEWAGDDKEYRISRIVGEFPRLGGEKLYQIQWVDWAHPVTGDTTSWHPETIFDDQNIGVKLKWDEEKAQQQRRIAQENLTEVVIGQIHDIPKSRGKGPKKVVNEETQRDPFSIHAFFTMAHAIDAENGSLEKIKMYRENGGGIHWSEAFNQPVRLLPEGLEESLASPRKRRRSASTQNQPVASGSSAAHARATHTEAGPSGLLSRPSESTSTAPQTDFLDSASEREDVKDDSDVDMRGVSEDVLGDPSSDDESQSSIPRSKRTALLRSWNAAASAAGAEALYICNEVDDEEVPKLPEGFTYLEDSYVYGRGVPEHLHPNIIKEFLDGCSCEPGRCSRAASCTCLTSADGDYYDNRGLLADSVIRKSLMVIECNVNCTNCAIQGCGNRVSQRPRRFPLEIFKTKDRGWGVRSKIDIPRGSVLGFYTGTLVHSDDPSLSKAPGSAYCYDLDMHDQLNGEDDEEDGPIYSILAYQRGNWTRFVNHSCKPLLVVVTVVFDTPQSREAFVPKLAYVAQRRIAAGDELTIDYDPCGKQQTGGRKCRCGAAECRGRVL